MGNPGSRHKNQAHLIRHMDVIEGWCFAGHVLRAIQDPGIKIKHFMRHMDVIWGWGFAGHNLRPTWIRTQKTNKFYVTHGRHRWLGFYRREFAGNPGSGNKKQTHFMRHMDVIGGWGFAGHVLWSILEAGSKNKQI